MKMLNTTGKQFNIRSFRDLQTEKEKLRLEMKVTEERLNADYRYFRDFFTPGNLVTLITNEILLAVGTFASAFRIGRWIFGKKKDRRAEGQND